MIPLLDNLLDFKAYMRMAWRWKTVMVGCTFVVLVSAKYAMKMAPREYASFLSVSVQAPEVVATQVTGLTGGVFAMSETYRTEPEQWRELRRRVRSRPLLERLIRVMELDQEPEIRAMAAKALEESDALTVDEMTVRMLVERLPRKISFTWTALGVYRIGFYDRNPFRAQEAANWIGELLVEMSEQKISQQLKSAHEFGALQMKHYQSELELAQQAVAEYREERIRDNFQETVVKPEELSVAEALHQRVLDDIAQARQRRIPYSLELLNAGLQPQSDLLLADPEILVHARNLSRELEDVLSRRIRGRRGAADWPPAGDYAVIRRRLLQTVERRVAELNPGMGEPERDTLSRFVYSTLDGEAYERAADYLEEALQRSRRLAKTEAEDDPELTRLLTAVDTNRELLESFRSQLIASEVRKAMDTGSLGMQLEVLEPAVLALAPIKPNRNLVIVSCLLIGPVLGMGIAFCVEFTGSTLRTLQQFRKAVSEPILGTLPYLGGIKGGEPLDHPDEDPVLGSEINLLEARLWRAVTRDSVSRLLVTSPARSEGKSMTMAHLAAALGRHSGRRILAVDLDFRAPSLNNYFHAEVRCGLDRVLLGEVPVREAIVSTKLPGLDLLLPGPGGADPQLLLRSAELESALESLSQDYDLMLIDTAALLRVSDTLAVVPLADAVLLCAMAGRTRHKELLHVHDMCHGVGSRVLGLVVGNMQEAAPEYVYQGGYYSYSDGGGEGVQRPTAS